MDRRFRFAAVATALAAVVAVPASAAAKTKSKTVTVYAGGPAAWAGKLQKQYGAGVNNFLINKVTINVGDTVDWNGDSLSNGFHTVDIPAKGGADLPLILPTGTTVSGVKDANQNPFWFNGQPNLGFNPTLASGPSGGNSYDGTGRVDSGLPFGPPTDFKVTFTKAGTYKYFCDVHYGMVGEVVVRRAGKPIPSDKRNANVLKAEEKRYFSEAKGLQHTNPGPKRVSLGASRGDGLEVFKMFPATLTVKKDTVVTFLMSNKTRETHTATFGDTSPSGSLGPLVQPGGGFQANPIDPRAVYPSDVPMPISVTSTSHGYAGGFSNSGALDRDSGTPLPSSATFKFTEPGTYHYICLIHSNMHGTIVVH